MKGFVVNIWLQTWSRIFGADVVKEMKNKYNVPDTFYNPLEDVPDELPVNMSRELASRKGITYEELWYKTGKENLKTFFEHYPEYFKKTSFLSFMAAMDMVHRVLTRRIKGAKPPRIFFKLLSSRKALIRYESKRNFKNYFLGLMEAASEFFNDPIKYKVVGEGSIDGRNYLEVEVEATKEYGKFEKLRSLIVLGAGFVKSLVPINVFMIPLFSFVFIFIIFTFLPFGNLLKSVFSAFLISLVMAFDTKDLKKGLNVIKESLKLVSRKNFDNPVMISGPKEFSDLSAELNNAVEKTKEIIVGILGDVQEIDAYSSKVVDAVNSMKEQLETMSSLSNEIATTAVQISNDTERISSAVTTNVETITSIISEQTQIIKSLNEAVSLIVQSANNVEQSADGIAKMSQRFSKLVEEAKNLQEQAGMIMQVAATVSSIAEQTNLLALNAAIEAARSGEAGRGFAVVADEIRKLAEESRSSSSKIAEYLSTINTGIDKLVKTIQAEFEEMKEQSSQLLESSERNKESSEVISSISQKLSDLIDVLNQQVDNLNGITNSIQNLLAISEESSATAEEISSSIQNFFSQLKVVLDSVNETINLLSVIKENFEDMVL
ncbi:MULTISPECIES: heme NO-binding domain-containing protein [unclassified Thermotoga]|uniref:heme NO-binding domain-containing protein n=1 Tax=unclassified Thermotoga TaxID=2631113 RepID=UPI000280EB10|nr:MULTISPECIES: heme NO-binding domain-containing protein [unclassified Thermotoga]AIY87333.1 methyl-accepting chemotaxis sensory transducer [Thermotoga sp. 2812B]EJX26399.1 methyl-accepting chemotaxis sensory transducer [Thermotoga sp. EMP]